ncbi:MAG: hypothetical protein EPN82_02325 [Bacteroidetes bacterium]|nr:MAG: hypothetical protein EPN82_02325 [Bacteroidota bacterium]
MILPEEYARQNIDAQLIQIGWAIQVYKHINLNASIGIAVREYPTDSGAADYMLFIEDSPVGVIEAKKESTLLTAVHEQAIRYASGRIKWFVNSKPLPFIYESTSKDHKAFMAGLKLVYKADTKSIAEEEMNNLEEKWVKKYQLLLNPGGITGII